MNIILLCLYLFCAAAVLFLCCFRAMKRINHHLRLNSGSTISKQDPDDRLVIQPVWLLLHNLP